MHSATSRIRARSRVMSPPKDKKQRRECLGNGEAAQQKSEESKRKSFGPRSISRERELLGGQGFIDRQIHSENLVSLRRESFHNSLVGEQRRVHGSDLDLGPTSTAVSTLFVRDRRLDLRAHGQTARCFATSLEKGSQPALAHRPPCVSIPLTRGL